MKKGMITISVLITTLGLTAFGFLYQPDNECATDVVEEVNGPEEERVLSFSVWAKYVHPITGEKLRMARSMQDVISDYPADWIMEYTSVEIRTRQEDKELVASCANDVFNSNQKEILNSAELAQEIEIDVHFKSKNTITEIVEYREMNFVVTVVPEQQAEFVGGHDALIAYLDDHSKGKVAPQYFESMRPVSLAFTIVENGKAEDVKMTRTSGIQEVDQSLIDLIMAMPKWKPAKNAQGLRVKQEFEMDVYGFGGGC